MAQPASASNGIAGLGATRLKSSSKTACSAAPPDSGGSPFRGRGAHAALKAAWSRGTQRECAFLCGRTSWDSDEEDRDVPYKWAYDEYLPDGSRKACNCYYCEKVFQNEYKHLLGRRELQKKLAKHKPTHDAFLEKKRLYIQRRKDGKRQFQQRDGGKQSLAHKEYDEDKLLKPLDDFYPLDRYIKQYGDPRLKENKEKGHKISRKYGVVGVIVPGDDGLQPWNLQRARGSKVEKTEHLHDACSSDDEFIIDRKFDELVDNREEDHKQVAVGLLNSLLAQHADPPATADAEEHVQAPKRKIVQMAKERQDDENIASKRRRLVVTLSEFSDSIDPEQGSAKSKPKSKAKAKARGGKASGSSGGGGASRSSAAGRSCGAVVPHAAASAAAPTPSSEPGGGGGTALAGQSAGESRGVGRPAQDPLVLLEEVRQNFTTAGENSLYFGEQHAVKLRQLHRAGAKAGEKSIAATSPEVKHKWEVTQKCFSVVETVVKMYKSWEGKKNSAQARAFVQSWAALDVFIKSEPVCGSDLIPVLLHRSHIECRVSKFFVVPPTVAMLSADNLVCQLSLPSTEHAMHEQVEFARLGFMGLMSDSQMATEVVVQSMCEVCDEFLLCAAKPDSAFDEALLVDVRAVKAIVTPSQCQVEDVEKALARVEKKEGGILELFTKFKEHGGAILGLAKEQCETTSRVFKAADDLSKRVKDASALTFNNPEEWGKRVKELEGLVDQVAAADDDLQARLAFMKVDVLESVAALSAKLANHVLKKWLTELGSVESVKDLSEMPIVALVRAINSKIGLLEKTMSALSFCSKWLGCLDDIKALASDTECDFSPKRLVELRATLDYDGFNSLRLVDVEPLSEAQMQEISKKVSALVKRMNDGICRVHTKHLEALAEKVRVVKAATEAENGGFDQTLESVDVGVDELHKNLTTVTTKEVAFRVDCVCRLLRTAASATRAGGVKFDYFCVGNDYEPFCAMAREALSLKQWIEDQPTVAIGGDLHGFGDMDVSSLAVTVSERATAMAKRLWAESLLAGNLVLNKLKEHSLPEGVLNAPGMLKDAELRKPVLENKGSEFLVADVKASKLCRAHLRRVHVVNPKFFDGFLNMDENLRSASYLARMTIGVEHVLKQVFGKFPANVSDIPGFARGIMTDLTRYGCHLPAFMEAFLKDMLKEGEAAAAATAPTEPEQQHQKKKRKAANK